MRLSAIADARERRALPALIVARDGCPAEVAVALPPAGPRVAVARCACGTRTAASRSCPSPSMTCPRHAVTAADGRTVSQRMLPLPPLPAGYHTLRFDDDSGETCRVVVTPGRCYLPPDIRDGGRRFGLAAHLYALRRRGDQGIGDFTTLAATAEATARAGGSIVGINPLHALFAADRGRASPYHPSDRRFLDPIYVDLDRVPDLAAADDARALLQQSRARIDALAAAPAVDYVEVWRLKRAVLEACFAAFERRPGADSIVAEFDRFVASGGMPLRQFALFEAIAAEHPRVPWQRVAPRLARARCARNRRFRDPARAPHPIRVVPAMARRAPAGRRRRTGAGERPDDGVLPRSGRRCRARRRRGVGEPVRVRARRGDRRTSRSVLHLRAELEPAPAQSGIPRRVRVRRLRRARRRQHAARRRAADRPRDGARAPVLDSGGCGRGRRRVRPVSARCPARGAGDGKRARELSRGRRGPGDRARGVARTAGGGRRPFLPGALVRARRYGFSRPFPLSGESGGVRLDARPADDRRLVVRHGHQREACAGPARRGWRHGGAVRATCLETGPGRGDRPGGRERRHADRRQRGARPCNHGGDPPLCRRVGVGSGAAAGRRPRRRNGSRQPAGHRPRTAELAAANLRRCRRAVADADRACGRSPTSRAAVSAGDGPAGRASPE